MGGVGHQALDNLVVLDAAEQDDITIEDAVTIAVGEAVSLLYNYRNSLQLSVPTLDSDAQAFNMQMSAYVDSVIDKIETFARGLAEQGDKPTSGNSPKYINKATMFYLQSLDEDLYQIACGRPVFGAQ